MSHQFTGERPAGTGFPHRVGKGRKWSSLDVAPPTGAAPDKDAALLARALSTDSKESQQRRKALLSAYVAVVSLRELELDETRSYFTFHDAERSARLAATIMYELLNKQRPLEGGE